MRLWIPDHLTHPTCCALQVRARELKLYIKASIIKIVNVAMVFGTPPLVASAVFISYQYGEGKINARMSFVLLSLCNILRFPLVVLPKAMRAFNEALSAIERIEDFLLAESISKDADDRKAKGGVSMVRPPMMQQVIK
jgi:ATP-binding cassette, subfamily C (CFTR/MRP), member 1